MRGRVFHQFISLLPTIEDQDQRIHHQVRPKKRNYLSTHIQLNQGSGLERLSSLPRQGQS